MLGSDRPGTTRVYVWLLMLANASESQRICPVRQKRSPHCLSAMREASILMATPEARVLGFQQLPRTLERVFLVFTSSFTHSFIHQQAGIGHLLDTTHNALCWACSGELRFTLPVLSWSSELSIEYRQLNSCNVEGEELKTGKQQRVTSKPVWKLFCSRGPKISAPGLQCQCLQD